MEVRLQNATTAVLRWRRPDERDMNGDLMGFKVVIAANGTQLSNFTLEPDSNSLVLYNISEGIIYNIQVRKQCSCHTHTNN